MPKPTLEIRRGTKASGLRAETLSTVPYPVWSSHRRIPRSIRDPVVVSYTCRTLHPPMRTIHGNAFPVCRLYASFAVGNKPIWIFFLSLCSAERDKNGQYKYQPKDSHGHSPEMNETVRSISFRIRAKQSCLITDKTQIIQSKTVRQKIRAARMLAPPHLFFD